MRAGSKHSSRQGSSRRVRRTGLGPVSAVRRLAEMRGLQSVAALPPAQMVREQLPLLELASVKDRESEVATRRRTEATAHLFLEYARYGRLGAGLSDAYERLTRLTLERPDNTAVLMYLMTGYLRPENQPYLSELLSSPDAREIADVLAALRQMEPTRRCYYTYLVKTNLFSKDFVEEQFFQEGFEDGFRKRTLSDLRNFFPEIPIVTEPETSGAMDNNPEKKHGTVSFRKSETTAKNLNKDGLQHDGEVKESKIVEPKELESVWSKESIVMEAEHLDDTYKYKYFDPLEEPDIDRAEIEKREQREIIREEGKKSESVISGSTKQSRKLVSANSRKLSQVRTNAATLLKEANVILKEEEEENKKLLQLLEGSSNFLEYERMIEERIEEEKELFRLKVERLHLEGKLTEQGMILARMRLQEESKERRRKFEEERKQLMEDMERLNELERKKVASIVAKVKELNEKVALKKKSLVEQKRLEVEALTRELKESLKETMRKKKEELEKKVLMIKELRAFQAFKKSLEKMGLLKKVQKKETRMPGFLCEMSLEELAERKAAMKSEIEEERRQRRQMILERMRRREELLNEAEAFVLEARQRRKEKKRMKELKKDGGHSPRDSISENLPETFRRPIPVVFEKEREAIAMAEQVRKAREEKINAFYPGRAKSMIQQYARKEPSSSGTPKDIKMNVSSKASDGELCKDVKERSLEEKVIVIWEKFKKYLKKRDLDFPMMLLDSDTPPWIMTYNIFDWVSKNFKSKSITRSDRSKRIRNMKENQSYMFSVFSQQSRTRTMMSTKFEKKMENRENKYKEMWRKFFLAYYRYCTVPQKLEDVDDAHTKKILAQIQYFHDLAKTERPAEKKKESILSKYKEEVVNLRVKLMRIEEEVRRKREGLDERESEREEDDEDSCELAGETLTTPYDKHKIPILEEEDKRIIHISLEPKKPVVKKSVERAEAPKKKKEVGGRGQVTRVRRREETEVIYPWEVSGRRSRSSTRELAVNEFGRGLYTLKAKGQAWGWVPVSAGGDGAPRTDTGLRSFIYDFVSRAVRADSESTLRGLEGLRVGGLEKIRRPPRATNTGRTPGPLELLVRHWTANPRGGTPQPCPTVSPTQQSQVIGE